MQTKIKTIYPRPIRLKLLKRQIPISEEMENISLLRLGTNSIAVQREYLSAITNIGSIKQTTSSIESDNKSRPKLSSFDPRT